MLSHSFMLVFFSIQSSSIPGLPNLSRCAACYNHKKSFLHGGDGESSSSAGDSEPEEDCESVSSSSSSSAEEEVPRRPSPPAGSEGGGRDSGEEVEGQLLESRAEGVVQTRPQNSPPSSAPPPRPLSHPENVVSTLHLQVVPQEHASDAFYIIRRQEEEEEEAEEDGGEEGGAWPLPPQMGWFHPPSQQHQPPHHHQHQYLHPFPMFPQHAPLLPGQGQRSAPALHPPLVFPWPVLHSWPQAAAAAQPHLEVPHPCWCCSSRACPPSGFQDRHSS